MRIPGHTAEDAPASSIAALEELRRAHGAVLDIHGSMADSPVVVNMYTRMNEVLRDDGRFNAGTREAIALAVAAENDCGYCQSAHTLAASRAGWSQEETVAIRSGTYDHDARLVAVLEMAREIAVHQGDVSEQTWNSAVKAGWTTAELGEAFGHVMVNVFTNYYNHLNHTELDLSAAPRIA